MKLYYAPGACSLAAHIVAAEGGLALDLEKVDLKTHRTEKGEDFKAINPKGYVPAIELDDGALLTENAALLPFVGDQTGLMPAQGIARYRALEWIGYINSEVHKSFAPLFHGASPDHQAKAKAEIISRLGLVEKGLIGDYLMGAAFSAPDAYLYVILRWAHGMKVDLAGMPRLIAFKARMDARPGVGKALKAEGLH
jgi:glutathione S-transferase